MVSLHSTQSNSKYEDIEKIGQGVPSSVMREINLLKMMDHPNIVKLLDVLSTDNKVSLVLEYVEYNLEKFILLDPSKTRDPLVIKRLLHNILSGVQYCNLDRIIHRDLELDNLLIKSQDKVVKLADFGLARTIDTLLGPLSKKRMLRWNPSDRITAAEALAHEYLLDIQPQT